VIYSLAGFFKDASPTGFGPTTTIGGRFFPVGKVILLGCKGVLLTSKAILLTSKEVLLTSKGALLTSKGALLTSKRSLLTGKTAVSGVSRQKTSRSRLPGFGWWLIFDGFYEQPRLSPQFTHL